VRTLVACLPANRGQYVGQPFRDPFGVLGTPGNAAAANGCLQLADQIQYVVAPDGAYILGRVVGVIHTRKLPRGIVWDKSRLVQKYHRSLTRSSAVGMIGTVVHFPACLGASGSGLPHWLILSV